MDIRYIVRHPHILTTPRNIAAALGVRTRQWPIRGRSYRPSLRRDFLFRMPEPQELQEAGDYECLLQATKVHHFFNQNKAEQRAILHNQGLPIPWTSTVQNTWNGGATQFVVRPLRHQQGMNYRVTTNSNDFSPGASYISELFAKEREYRIIFVYGEPVVFLRKRVPEGTPRSAPWNHSVGGTFRTINDTQNSKPTLCGAVEALRNNPIVRSAHIVGADILWKTPNEWVIVEFNSAPAIDIPANIEKVARFIKEHQL